MLKKLIPNASEREYFESFVRNFRAGKRGLRLVVWIEHASHEGQALQLMRTVLSDAHAPMLKIHFGKNPYIGGELGKASVRMLDYQPEYTEAQILEYFK